MFKQNRPAECRRIVEPVGFWVVRTFNGFECSTLPPGQGAVSRDPYPRTIGPDCAGQLDDSAHGLAVPLTFRQRRVT